MKLRAKLEDLPNMSSRDLLYFVFAYYRDERHAILDTIFADYNRSFHVTDKYRSILEEYYKRIFIKQ